ncbi:hypothetical protein HMPREF1544_05160, partial [Mucor circinelloides 1006PhL]
ASLSTISGIESMIVIELDPKEAELSMGTTLKVVLLGSQESSGELARRLIVLSN